MRLLNTPKTVYISLALGILVLALLNFWGWFFLQSFERKLLDELSLQTRRTSEVYALQITEKFIFADIFSLDPDNLRLIALQQTLYEFQRTAELETIFITSPDRSRFITPDFTETAQARIRQYPLNDSLFQKAAFAERAYVERTQLGDTYFLTSYTPVSNEFGVPVGVLVIESPADVFNALAIFRRTLLISGIAGVAVLFLFAGVIVTAIRQLFQLRDALHQQTRLAQLGQMAAMVAHEIRNPLSIIKGTAEVLRKKYRGEKEEMFDFIPEEINRLNRLVNDFLQFARQRELPLSPQNPVETLQIMQRQFQDSRVSFDLPASCPSIPLNGDALKQVMFNLIDNAMQSTPAVDAGGKVVVSLRMADQRSRKAIIEVRDNGTGMSGETLQRAFEPFFSTRATGSGLGLAITSQLVEQMNGEIRIDSREGSGTTVQLVFPLK